MTNTNITQTSPVHDILVFIGRFQPFHLGHMEVILTALSRASNVVILVGSSDQPRTSKNPWTFAERQDMIMESLAAVNPRYCSRVSVRPLKDQKYNDQRWTASVQEHIDDAQMVIRLNGYEPNTSSMKIGIIGHSKDESSYYLKMFPQWGLIEHALNEDVNATDLRRLIFEDKSLKFLKGVLTPHVYDMIGAFKKTEHFALLQREYDMLVAYKTAWKAAPYPVTFVTVDAVVVQSGHVLLVQRDAAPGEGLLAMPGGFLEQNEWIEDGVIRELREETGLKVPAPVLKGSTKYRGVYDRPDRSMRGRTITHAYLIELPAGPLPPVKGGDDARDARWVPINEINEQSMFEDHYHIIIDLLGKI